MAAPIITYTAESCEIPYEQIIRYIGMAGQDVPENIMAMIGKALPVMVGVLKYKACYLETNVSITNSTVSFDYFSVDSHNLSSVLIGCQKAVLIAATVGPGADMLVKRAEVTSKAEALIYNSIAIAAIESFMGVFNGYLKTQFPRYELRPRYSPGYGDVPLSTQKELLSTLDTNRKIGVALSDSLLMTPTKSVSAIIGLGEEGCVHVDRDCDICSKRDCEFRLS